MLTFSSKGKNCVKCLGGKARVKKISSLPGESPSHSSSTLCLGSDRLSTPFTHLDTVDLTNVKGVSVLPSR